jgi:hypothetical protein
MKPFKFDGNAWIEAATTKAGTEEEHWSVDGKLYYKCRKNNQGMLHGKYEQWHKNGNRWVDGEYENGKPCGKWIYWSENGQIYINGQWKNGKQCGKWTWFDIDGRKCYEQWFNDVEELVREIEYCPNGDVWLMDENCDRMCLIGCAR